MYYLKCLVLSPTPTWPLNYGNRKRIYSVCRALQNEGVAIDFLYYPSESDWRLLLQSNAYDQMKMQWQSFFIVPPTRPLHTNSAGIDHTIDEWWDESIENYLKWLFSVKRYDMFVVNYTWLSKAFSFAPNNVLKILDTHDKFSGRRALLSCHGINPEFFHTTEAEESIAFDRADLVLAIKKEEEIFFQSLTKTLVQTLTHIDSIVEQPCGGTNVFSGKYLKIGSIGANNNINVVNLQNFLDVCLPIFEKYMAPIQIVIAGGQCEGIEKKYSRNFVTILGKVDSVDDFYNNIDVVFVPIAFSTGLKIKIGEAISRGIPIVSHKHAFEGYPVCHAAHECLGFEEIAMTLVRLSFDLSQLEGLKKASFLSRSKIEFSFIEQIKSIVQRSKQFKKSLAFIISADSVANNLYVKNSILSSAYYFSYIARIFFYITGEAGNSDCEFYNDLTNIGEVIYESKNCDAEIVGRIKSLEIYAALFWHIPKCHDVDLFRYNAIWFLSGLVDLNSFSSNEKIISKLASHIDVTIIDTSAERGSHLSALIGKPNIAVPFFYTRPNLRFVDALAVIFVNEKTQPLLDPIVKYIRNLCCNGAAIWVVSDDLQIVSSENITSAHLGEIFIGTCPTPLPSFALDLSADNSSFSILKNIYNCFKIPCIELESFAQGYAVQPYRPQDVVSLCRVLSSFDFSSNAQKSFHQSELGWSYLWNQLSNDLFH